MMQTHRTKAAEIERKWFVVDATDKTLGRLATVVATMLRGKNKPNYAPNVDCGDFVVVINAEKVKVTGDKLNQKTYYRHSGYPGGLKEMKLGKALEKKPVFVIEHAVKGMLPSGPLGSDMYRKLKVYAGPEHPHSAQKPEVLEV